MTLFITRKSRASCGFVMGYLWFVARKSRDCFINPNHKKEPFGRSPKGDSSKGTFFARKTWKKAIIFRRPTL